MCVGRTKWTSRTKQLDIEVPCARPTAGWQIEWRRLRARSADTVKTSPGACTWGACELWLRFARLSRQLWIEWHQVGTPKAPHCWHILESLMSRLWKKQGTHSETRGLLPESKRRGCSFKRVLSECRCWLDQILPFLRNQLLLIKSVLVSKRCSSKPGRWCYWGLGRSWDKFRTEGAHSCCTQGCRRSEARTTAFIFCFSIKIVIINLFFPF